MDIVSESVGFCCRYHGLDGLTFAQSDAHLLPFSDGAFDVVVNVESSGHYADGERFLGEVVRVLRPGGHFLYADVRYWEDLEAWHGQIAGTGLHVVREQNITPNVVHALALDGARRQRLINRIAPRPFHKVFKKFAGVGDSAFLQVSPEPGKRVYMSYVLRKECG
jgi:SAM-dependent methyltransferase